MKLKRSLPIKNICIILFLFLGVLLFKNIFPLREGITADGAKALTGRIENTVKQEMSAAGVPYDSPDTSGLLNQLSELMTTELKGQQERANVVSSEITKAITPAANTITPTLIDNSFFNGNKFSDAFCEKYVGSSELEDRCANLTADNCNLTDCCVYVNGTKCMAGNAKGPTNTNTVITDADYYSYKYQCNGNCISDSKCSKFINSDKNVSDDCLREMWANAGCTTPIPGTNWWKAQTKSGVSKDMDAWASMPDSYHRRVCYGDIMKQWPSLSNKYKKVVGNNGTVSCSKYCGGINGSSWNNELPANWKGAVCAAAGFNNDEDCNRIRGMSSQGMPCICQRSDDTPWSLYN